MRFSAPCHTALVASLLANRVLAAVQHRGHQDYHAKRADIVVTEDVIETITVTDYVTVDWTSTSTPSVSPTPRTVSRKTRTHSSKSVSTIPPAVTSSAVPQVAVAAAAPATTLTTIAKAPAPAAPAAVVASSPAPVAPAVVASSPAPVVPAAVAPPAAAAVVAPSSSPSPAAPAASTPPSTPSGPKRGAAYNTASLVDAFTGSKVSWAYNWGTGSDGLSSAFEFVPMLWGLGSHSDGWNSAANAALASGSTHLLAFNEPDLGEQSNIGVDAAVSGYKQFVQPFAGRARLGSPAVTNGAAPMGLAYLSAFLGACTGCTVDFVAIHWYDSASNAAYFKQHVSDTHAAGGGRPVWVTEFGAAGSPDEQSAFLAEVLPWLDAQDYVERYAYFMASDGRLLSGNSLSSVGQTFAHT